MRIMEAENKLETFNVATRKIIIGIMKIAT